VHRKRFQEMKQFKILINMRRERGSSSIKHKGRSRSTRRRAGEVQQIREGLKEQRRTLAIHLQQLENGTIEGLIKKHLDNCPSTRDVVYCKHSLLGFDRMLAYYRNLMSEHIIQAVKSDIEHLETQLIKAEGDRALKYKSWACDICHNPPSSKDKPLHVMFDGSLLCYDSCLKKEIEHRRLIPDAQY
jgi:hypothetical protein